MRGLSASDGVGVCERMAADADAAAALEAGASSSSESATTRRFTPTRTSGTLLPICDATLAAMDFFSAFTAVAASASGLWAAPSE